MKNLGMVLRVSLLIVASSGAWAQTLDWQGVETLSPRDWILVETQKRTQCEFQKATSDQLFCHAVREDWLSAFSSRERKSREGDLVFDRKEIRAVRKVPYDDSREPLDLILAVGGGGGLDSAGQPISFGGVKAGGPVSLDLQYDRIHGMNGFSAEGSAVIPLFRIPRFQFDKEVKFVKFYAEPGVGYRAGSGPFGGYSSAKVMAVLLTDTWSDSWVAPYVEYQRRFPFDSPLEGDNRLTFGIMVALCAHCGFN